LSRLCRKPWRIVTLGDAEIHDLEQAIVSHEEVAWLDVSVDVFLDQKFDCHLLVQGEVGRLEHASHTALANSLFKSETAVYHDSRLQVPGVRTAWLDR
jgi:hypothetical protein